MKILIAATIILAITSLILLIKLCQLNALAKEKFEDTCQTLECLEDILESKVLEIN
jgi:uncharacterized protein YoxC